MPLIETPPYSPVEDIPTGLDRSVSVLVEPGVGEVLDSLFNREVQVKPAVVLVPRGIGTFAIDLNEVEEAVSQGDQLLGLFSSGSTGIPKLCFHSVRSLSKGANNQHDGKVWGMLYLPDRMAGIQVLLQAVASNASIVEAAPTVTLEQTIEEFATHGVDSLSATPSRWRMILSAPSHKKLNLRSASIGGETCDQQLLDQMLEAFPLAKIRHIYATTETGPVFSVGDGLAGFPASFLGRRLFSGRMLTIVDGQLSVSWSEPAFQTEIGILTGDLVEIAGDRVHFVGRADDIVNVGGTKVSLNQIERAISELSGVEDCVAYSMRNPFLGEVVGADVVWRGQVPSEMETKTALLKSLPRQAVPAIWNAVEEIGLSDTFKKIRRR